MTPGSSERALVLAPRGRDAAVAASMLAESGMRAHICDTLGALIAELRAGAGFAVVTDEALRTADLRPLATWIEGQPEWSDFPFVLLTERGGGLERNPAASRHLETLGNVTFLERPFHPTTLISLAHAALRGRRRQYDARARLEELRESEDHYRHAVESNPQVAWTALPDGRIETMAPRWMDWTGTSGLAGSWAQASHPDDVSLVLDAWDLSLATGEPFDIEHRVKVRDGSEHWMHTRAYPRRDGEGRIVKWYGVIEDIQERKAAEDSLAQSEARFRAITDSIDQMIWSSLPDGSHDYYNQRWYDYTGAPTGSTDGAGWSDMLHPEDRERAWSRWRRSLASGEPYHIEYRLRHNSGVYRWVLGRAQPVHNSAGSIVRWYGTCTDIDDEVRAREVLARSREALEQEVAKRAAEHERALAQLHEVQKLETLGQLTGGVAHDFNNLLTPITGALDILQRRYAADDPRAARLIGGALQSAERAKTLVQRLLGFARRQALETQPVDIGAVLGGMHDLIKSSIGPGIALRIVADVDLPPALADANQLELALLNLCVNARDAMADGGVLTISAERTTVAHDHPMKLEPGDYVRLAIEDTGAGMSAETLARAVEPFFSTKETGRGTGLGLSMVHGLAAQLGGGFALSSAVGRGTTAELLLPIASGAVRAAVVHAPIGDGDRPALAVLLVDDEDLVRAGSADMLRDLGHTVHEANGGAKALELLAGGLAVDAVVTDYKMPNIDGAKLARRIREFRPELPILLITGYLGTGEDAIDLPRLAKPFRQSDIAASLHALVRPAAAAPAQPSSRASS